jgi:serine/threonine protein kinase
MKFQYTSGSRPLEGYTIKRGIGKGGFGEVYFAASDAGKEVALKHVERNLEVELRGVGQCLNLKHANLIDLFDIRYDEQGEAWVVMEYIAGASLKDVIDRNPNGLPKEEVESWFRGIAAGTAYLHDHGIVHRDLKPGNIFEDEGCVKIGDYGLSKFISCSRRSGQTESVGTFHYMAPEIGKGAYGKEIDIYALGIVLYEMVTGHVPFEGESSQEIIMKHLTADPDLSAVPQPYRGMVERALKKDPEKRFKNVSEMVALLDASKINVSVKTPATGLEIPIPAVPQPSKLAGNGVLERVVEAKVTIVKGAQPADKNTAQPDKKPEPHYIGDDELEMSFGPVKKDPKKSQVPPVRRGPNNRGPGYVPAQAPGYVPGSYRALPAVPRAEEPIASALKRGMTNFGQWWNSGGTPLKILLIVGFVVALIFAWPWVIPAAVVLAMTYVVYLGIWLVAQAMRGSAAGESFPIEGRYVTWEQQYRSVLRMKTVGDRVGELAGSMLASAAIAAVLTVAMSAIGGGDWISPATTTETSKITGPAWLWLAITAASWTLLTAGKFWEHSTGEQVKRRFMLLVLGLAFGGAAFLSNRFLMVNMLGGGVAVETSNPISRGMIDATGAPLLSCYLAFFGGLFVLMGWWKQTDPLRTSRLRIAPIVLSVLAAGVLTAIFDFPLPWGLLVAGGISTTVQLASPWLKPQDRLAIRQRVTQGRV